jgi:hypothetical protein
VLIITCNKKQKRQVDLDLHSQVRAEKILMKFPVKAIPFYTQILALQQVYCFVVKLDHNHKLVMEDVIGQKNLIGRS